MAIPEIQATSDRIQSAPVKRRLFNLLSGMSLLLCVVMMALLLRSYSVDEAVYWSNSTALKPLLLGHFYSLNFEHGRFSFFYSNLESNSPESQATPCKFGYSQHLHSLEVIPSGSLPPQYGWSHLGCGYLGMSDMGVSYSLKLRFLFLPAWLIASAFAVAPLLWISHWRRRLRFATGLCPHCGYDFRATPDRCPECGTIPDKVTVKS
jgi:hypothetical protein